jgi:hypothetical protein
VPISQVQDLVVVASPVEPEVEMSLLVVDRGEPERQLEPTVLEGADIDELVSRKPQ